jgi:1,4-dihydroxy-2-naphthoate octaprenyltransferase
VLAVTAILLSASATLQLSGKWPSLKMAFFIGASTFIAYYVAAWKPYLQWRPMQFGFQKAPLKRHFLIYLFGLGLLLFFTLPADCRPGAFLITGITFLYFLQWGKDGKHSTGLRSIPLIKNILLAGSWTLMTVWLPNHLVWSTASNYLLVSRFIYLLAICFGVDLRDITTDRKQDHTTLSVLLGFRTMKYCSLILLVIFAAFTMLQPEITFIQYRGSIQRMTLLISTAIIIAGFLHLKENDRSEKFTILLDGHMFLQGLLICLLY